MKQDAVLQEYNLIISITCIHLTGNARVVLLFEMNDGGGGGDDV